METANYLFNDGAAWIWNIVRMCRVEIIDWWHAVDVVDIAQFDAESEQTEALVSAKTPC